MTTTLTSGFGKMWTVFEASPEAPLQEAGEKEPGSGNQRENGKGGTATATADKRSALWGSVRGDVRLSSFYRQEIRPRFLRR